MFAEVTSVKFLKNEIRWIAILITGKFREQFWQIKSLFSLDFESEPKRNSTTPNEEQTMRRKEAYRVLNTENRLALNSV